ncbi:hypothetical protein [Nocardia sp. NPDC127526]|uniref:hypothetical protein n=1 Tax=Nocardia sp. NPDC127526 TaxID=3345393 RepID=UPI00363AB023
MTNGFDDRNNDPEGRDPTENWWQGAPGKGSPWQSPRPPNPRPAPNPRSSGPNPQSPGPNPQPSGRNPFFSGPNPYVSAPNPNVPGSNPYVSGPDPRVGPNPYATGQNPYQPTPPPFGYPPTPGPGRGRIWLYFGIAALVIALVTVVAVVLVTRDPDITTQPPSTTPASTTTTRPPTTTTSSGPTTPAPIIPGYQVVVPSGVTAAWDVPADWQIDQSITEFGSGADTVQVAGLAQEGVNYCPDYVRSSMFLTTADQADPSAAALDVGARMARLGWTPTAVNASTPEPFDSSDHDLHGVYAETSGAFTPPAPSCASTFTIYTFALGGESGALVLTIAADTGIDRAVTRDFARTLLATFRLI